MTSPVREPVQRRRGRARPARTPSECTSRKPTPAWSTSAGQQVGPVPLDLLQIGTRPGMSANDTIAMWPETTQTTPGATRGTSPRLAGRGARGRAGVLARSTRSRSRRATGPRASRRARRSTCQPSVGRRLSFGAGQVRASARLGAAAEPADQLLDRLPEPVGERLALGLPVVGQRDEEVRAAAPAAVARYSRPICWSMLRSTARRVDPLDAGVVGDLVVAEEVGVDAPAGRPACPRSARRRRRRGRSPSTPGPGERVDARRATTRGRTSARRSRAAAASSRTMSTIETPRVRTAFTGLAK